jgi:ubiquinone/menaquinone biosynthesis C-methylase UbiE
MTIDEFYDESYKEVIESGAIGKVASIYHKMLESGHKRKFDTVLEIGAGTGLHFKYIKHDFSKYISSDIRNPGKKLEKISDERHEFLILNAENLETFKNESIDRIVIICVLPHLNDPEKALGEFARVLKKGGVMDIYVPCEPSLLLGIAQRLSTKVKMERLGYDYEKIIRREHRNHYPLLRMLILEIFENDDVVIRHFPPGIKFWQFSLFSTFRISKT